MTPVGAAHNLLGLAGFTAAIAGIWLCGRRSPDAAYRAWSTAAALASLTGLVLRIALAKVARIASLNGTLQRTFVAMLLGWRFVTAWRELRGTADRHSARSA